MTRIISEILGQLYQDHYLYQCFYEELRIHPERVKKVHYIVMNYDKMTSGEIEENVFAYGATIEEEDLFARQIFLCLLRLVQKEE